MRTTQADGSLLQDGEVILIGRAHTPIDDAADRLLDGCVFALQEFDTETLEGIAARRDEINPGGWMQAMLAEHPGRLPDGV